MFIYFSHGWCITYTQVNRETTRHTINGTGQLNTQKVVECPDHQLRFVLHDQGCPCAGPWVCLAKQYMVQYDDWKTLKNVNQYEINPKSVIQELKISLEVYKMIRRKKSRQLSTILRQTTGIPADVPVCLDDVRSFVEALQIRIAVVAASPIIFYRASTNDLEDRPLLHLIKM